MKDLNDLKNNSCECFTPVNSKLEEIYNVMATEDFKKIKEKQNENYFQILNDVDVSDKIEKKNGLTYLSWSYAWGELKKKYPNSYYTIYENKDGLNYFTDGKTCWVKTGVTVIRYDGDTGVEHIEYLPIMNHRNKSIYVEEIESTDVNKAIQRSLTKACARHGVGLYVYAGEDLPETKKKEIYDFDKKIKSELNEAIKEYAKIVKKKQSVVTSELSAKYGKPNTWNTERIISITDNLTDLIADSQIIEEDEKISENEDTILFGILHENAGDRI